MAAAATSAALVWSEVARAEGSETDRQIAQSLFDDGRALLEAGRYAEACPKFAESQRLDPGGGTLLNLALCHEMEGKTASAWQEFRDALSQAIRDHREDRQELATTHIATLGPKLVRLMVVVPDAVAAREPEVTLDRSRLAPAAWNAAIPIDPGGHRVAVVAPGSQPWETSVDARDPGKTYRVEVPVEVTALSLQSTSTMTDSAPATAREPRGRSTAFWILLGGAGAALATSVATGFMALDANGYLNDNCSVDRNFCRVPDAEDAASRARTFAWISTATLAAGAGAALVAFLLPLEPPQNQPNALRKATFPAVLPSVAASGVSVGVSVRVVRF